MFLSYVHRTRIIENCPSKSRNTQASWKSMSSLKERISSMKAHRSSSDRRATRAARDIDKEEGSGVVGFSSSSIWTVQVVWMRVFLLGQSRTRWPCFPHSKHWPIFWYFLHSLSFVALRMTAEVSIASSFRGGRRGRGGVQFPGPHQFWLLDPGLLPPGRCQTHPEVCLCPCPWVWLLNVLYSEWSDLVFK